jgi:predicted CopG family antitoxin
MATQKNIKLTEEVWRELREEKPDGVTWSYYLKELHSAAQEDSDDDV